MPVITTRGFALDYLDAGSGPLVLLVHSAASNKRQWRQLVSDYQHRYRFLAINLFGYGKTSPWPGHKLQTMADQVGLVTDLCAHFDEPLSLVGHSFGGAVAAATAAELTGQIAALVLLEANPFPLLASGKRPEAYGEILELRDFIKQHGETGAWERVAERFVDYWLGAGAWTSLPVDRQQAFMAALPNNFHEWDAIMSMDVAPALWQGIQAPTLLVRAKETTRSIEGIYELLREQCPHWLYQEVPGGGHMAPVTRPDLVNPLIVDFLDSVVATAR